MVEGDQDDLPSGPGVHGPPQHIFTSLQQSQLNTYLAGPVVGYPLHLLYQTFSPAKHSAAVRHSLPKLNSVFIRRPHNKSSRRYNAFKKLVPIPTIVKGNTFYLDSYILYKIVVDILRCNKDIDGIYICFVPLRYFFHVRNM